jgi:hypothetical protein
MAKYRKKPVVIEATQWFKMGDHERVVMRESGEDPEEYKRKCPMIYGLEGWHIVTPGDWTCKPDIFEATYEAV